MDKTRSLQQELTKAIQELDNWGVYQTSRLIWGMYKGETNNKAWSILDKALKDYREESEE